MGQRIRPREYPTATDERISATFRALCSGTGTQPADVALALGIAKATLYNKINGSTQWKASEVTLIAKHFGVSVDELLSGMGGMFGPPSEPDPGSDSRHATPKGTS